MNFYRLVVEPFVFFNLKLTFQSNSIRKASCQKVAFGGSEKKNELNENIRNMIVKEKELKYKSM